MEGAADLKPDVSGLESGRTADPEIQGHRQTQLAGRIVAATGARRTIVVEELPVLWVLVFLALELLFTTQPTTKFVHVSPDRVACVDYLERIRSEWIFPFQQEMIRRSHIRAWRIIITR